MDTLYKSDSVTTKKNQNRVNIEDVMINPVVDKYSPFLKIKYSKT